MSSLRPRKAAKSTSPISRVATIIFTAGRPSSGVQSSAGSERTRFEKIEHEIGRQDGAGDGSQQRHWGCDSGRTRRQRRFCHGELFPQRGRCARGRKENRSRWATGTRGASRGAQEERSDEAV